LTASSLQRIKKLGADHRDVSEKKVESERISGFQTRKANSIAYICLATAELAHRKVATCLSSICCDKRLN
jgi:hypothetical protein